MKPYSPLFTYMYLRGGCVLMTRGYETILRERYLKRMRNCAILEHKIQESGSIPWDDLELVMDIRRAVIKSRGVSGQLECRVKGSDTASTTFIYHGKTKREPINNVDYVLLEFRSKEGDTLWVGLNHNRVYVVDEINRESSLYSSDMCRITDLKGSDKYNLSGRDISADIKCSLRVAFSTGGEYGKRQIMPIYLDLNIK